MIENRLLRKTLIRLFRKRPDLVVGQDWQPDVTACLAAAIPYDVLVIDSFRTPWLATTFMFESVGQLGLKAVLIGMDADEAQFMAAVHSGVMGYLLKGASVSDVVAAVRAVFRGEAVCPPQLCSTLFRYVAPSPRGRPPAVDAGRLRAYLVRHVPDHNSRSISSRFPIREEPTLPDRDSVTIPIKLTNKAVLYIEATALRELGTEREVIDLQKAFSIKAVREAIQGISSELAKALESARPQKASVEFGIEVGLKSGKLAAVLVKGNGKANLNITLEWGVPTR